MPNPAHIPSEFTRYREMLEPLASLVAGGSRDLPPDESHAWEGALATLRGYHGDHPELEEAVAVFARVMWAAPGWAEPPARIAQALVARTRHWPDEAREQALRLAERFSDRALVADKSNLAARTAATRVYLATGMFEEAERMSLLLPTDDGPSLAVRSELAEARSRVSDAIRLREEQLAVETTSSVVRDARNKLGLLYQAARRLDDAIEVHRQNLTRHPDYAWGRVNLGSALEAKGDLVAAYAEVESAVQLGLEDARPFLDELGAALDKRALELHRRQLRTATDADAFDLCPATPY